MHPIPGTYDARAVTTARGTVLLNSVEFVCGEFGSSAHDQVLAALSPDHAAAFTASLHEGSRKPLDALIAYMEKARILFARDDPSFFRRMGASAGQHDREQRAFRVMLSDPQTATRMATILWRTYFDCGRLEVVGRSPGEALLRIHDFPTHRALCARILGSLEGQQGDFGARAQETACTLDGDPYCEIRLSFTKSSPFPSTD